MRVIEKSEGYLIVPATNEEDEHVAILLKMLKAEWVTVKAECVTGGGSLGVSPDKGTSADEAPNNFKERATAIQNQIIATYEAFKLEAQKDIFDSTALWNIAERVATTAW